MRFTTAFLMILGSAAFAAEVVKYPLDVGTLKTRDGKVFEEAKVLGKDAVGVKIIHSGGTARISFDRLPKELAARFPVDRDAAREQLEKEAEKEVAHDRAIDRTLAKRTMDGADGDAAGSEKPLEAAPKSRGNRGEKIASLEAYIRRLEAGIENARTTAADARRRASRYRETATTYVTRSDGNGGVIQSTVVNGSRLKRAEFQENRAIREEGRIEEARDLIAEANQSLRELREVPKN